MILFTNRQGVVRHEFRLLISLYVQRVDPRDSEFLMPERLLGRVPTSLIEVTPFNEPVPDLGLDDVELNCELFFHNICCM